jgi:hypothetical protein
LFVGKRLFQPFSHKNSQHIFCMNPYGQKGTKLTA